MKTILETKKANAKKRNQVNRETALAKYEEKQREIRKLLKQIEAGIEASDRDRTGSVNWGHVGSLSHIERQLSDIRDMLQGKGEYAR